MRRASREHARTQARTNARTLSIWNFSWAWALVIGEIELDAILSSLKLSAC